ncbi:MAG: bifunctional DNA-formamidopyrimidine glycosylase/DNA-(apurinic or apyrimidinic site) lyase, partial [Patescibacteria group bacterium]
MPELPEVETIKQQLEKAILNKKISGVEIFSKKQFPDNPKLVIGEKIIDVQRRAKVIILKLTNYKNLLIHLKLSGQLIWIKNAAKTKTIKLKRTIPTIGEQLPSKSTRVILQIGKGKLFFNELRKFGWIKVFTDKELEKELSKYGVEPFDKEFTSDYLEKLFKATKRAVKIALLDQEKIAGIGNIYANEALFLSKIHPQTPANGLKKPQIEQLRQNIIKVLKLGLKYGGTSDEYYLQPDTSLGTYQNHFLVYSRDGQKCLNCQTKIKRIKLGGR